MPAYGDYNGSRDVGYGTPAGQPSGGEYYQPPAGAPPVKEENHDKRNMMLGAAAGLAVGAVGGALVMDALGESLEYETLSRLTFILTKSLQLDDDDEHRPPPPAEFQPPAEPPLAENAYGEPISHSDRESIASAREEYQEALHDSDASSSDVEEAREEYEEEVEEAYYDD